MAQLKDLLVNGPARIIGEVYFNKIPKHNNVELALNHTISITAGDGLTGGSSFELNDASTNTVSIAHSDKPALYSSGTTINTALSSVGVAAGGTGTTFITDILIDKHGHIAGVKTASESGHGNFKTKQTAKNSPTTSGASTLAFIDTISQDTNGVITATKKSVDLSNYVTKADAASGMTFKGTLKAGVTIPKPVTSTTGSTIGDMYKAIENGDYFVIDNDSDNTNNTKFTGVKIGDTFICNSSGQWVHIPAGNDVTKVSTGTGLCVGDNGAATGTSITSSGTIHIKNGGVGTTQIANKAVTGYTSSSSPGKIALKTIDNENIKDTTITLDKLATSAYSISGNRPIKTLVATSANGVIESDQYDISVAAVVKASVKYDTGANCIRFVFAQ